LHDTILICQRHPEILVFLSLGLGYLIGKIKLFGFNLGSTTSVLLVALVLGQINVSVTPLIKTISFALFIFTVGFQVGPQFLNSVKKNGVNYLVLTLFFTATSLTVAIILGKLFGFDQGTTAGLLSGSMTQSSVMGTAEGALQNLSLSAVQKNLLISHIAIAHAITYIFGFAGMILFYKIIPQLIGINLKQEAKKVEALLNSKKSRRAVQHKGSIIQTDIVMIGIGCTLGILLGLISIKIGNIPFTLGIGGGVLVSGLFFGWLRSASSCFGDIPPSAQWLLTNLGLNLFIACVGLTAAPQAIEALQAYGFSLFFAGIILALTPHILGILFGRLVLKMNYCLLLGALAGAGTVTPALKILETEAESSVPALGYTIPYALSNFILTLLGSMIVYLMR